MQTTKARPAGRRRLARGTATRERILDAAERLLRARLFEQIAIADLVRDARATVGSFYNLFPDKEALLSALYERSCRRTLDQLDTLLAPERWAGRPLAEVVQGVVEALVRLYRRERGLMRALVLRGHCRTDAARARLPEMDAVIPRIAALIARWRADIDHAQPRRAAALGFLAVLATARERMLYPQTSAHAVRISERELVPELTRMYLAYLCGPR